MKTLNLLTATLDDIVFEGRNQAYGAYVLRRLYYRHLATAVAAAVALCLLLLSIPVLVQRLLPEEIITPAFPLKPDVVTLTDIVLPPKPLPRTEAIVAPAARREVVVKANPAEVIAKIVPDEQVMQPISKSNLLEEPTLTGALIGSVPMPGTSTGTVTTAPGTDSGKAVTAPTTKPFLTAEVMPDFVGGPEALRRYMERNLRFPSRAASAAVSGRVYISFTVNADGSISDVAVLKGLGYGTDEEAVRVVSKMPPWTPGRQNSHPVAVRYTMPITFQYQ